ncbi:alpha/beta hydrolase [Microbacterium sp.]|uniref:alpha/beta hydrolase n=1 Tax=Microbacterium sp. TaxID=51671 RepID=UPI002E33486B|nr:alpha/beta hydrolase fold domain-containing protein [Microbacterium sp.]HEX5730027.1 alpha/beta hydrolase fold domain-containing protein [Microbacterium sp.]
MPLDPWIETHLPLLHAMDELGGFDTAEGRAKWDEFFTPPGNYQPPPVRVEDISVARSGGKPHLRLLVYRPAHNRGQNGVGLVWMHGGGFTGGDVDMFEADGVARELAFRASATIISVDYRLADAQTHFPAPVSDVIDAIAWVRQSAADLGIRSDRLGIGGASAGAVLAMSAALMMRDASEEVPARIVLAYPGMHPVLPSLPHELGAKLTIVPQILNYGPRDGRADDNPALRAFLGGPEWSATAHSTPGLADLNGLPPTLIVNSEYDALRASGQLFAAQLAQAGIDVSVRNERGVLHGHLNLAPTIPAVSASLTAITEFITRD